MESIEKAIELVGGVPALAEYCGVSRQAVYQWRRGIKRPGLEACLAIEIATEYLVTRRELRPEWFQ